MKIKKFPLKVCNTWLKDKIIYLTENLRLNIWKQTLDFCDPRDFGCYTDAEYEYYKLGLEWHCSVQVKRNYWENIEGLAQHYGTTMQNSGLLYEIQTMILPDIKDFEENC